MSEVNNLVDLKTHKYLKDQLISVNHYTMVHAPNGSEKYYLQAGKVFCGMNKLVDEVPEWLKEKMKTMNPHVLEKCGFGLKGMQAKTNLNDSTRLDQLLKEGLISPAEHYKLTSEVQNEEIKIEETNEEGKEVLTAEVRRGRPKKVN